MENISDILSGLLASTKGERNESALFAYQFNGLSVRGVFFGRSLTLIVGISEKNVAWQCDVANGMISESIPREAYYEIDNVLVDNEEKRTNKHFFLALRGALEKIVTGGKVHSPTDEEIKGLIRCCKTRDKKYDSEGERPFFDFWRRVSPGPEGKKKIQRYFGFKVLEECYRNKVTAVWTAEPKDKCLLFLDPCAAIQNMRNAHKK